MCWQWVNNIHWYPVSYHNYLVRSVSSATTHCKWLMTWQNTVKPPLVDSPNKRTRPIKWTTWHARIELFNTNKPPNKGHLYLKDNIECTNVSIIERFYCIASLNQDSKRLANRWFYNQQISIEFHRTQTLCILSTVSRLSIHAQAMFHYCTTWSVWRNRCWCFIVVSIIVGMTISKHMYDVIILRSQALTPGINRMNSAQSVAH